MGSRLHWRRSVTAAGLYGSTALGVLGTVIAARAFSKEDFGLFATVFVAVGFFQVLLDLTVEESLTKYGFRYATAEEWGKLRRLFRRALELKLAGGVLAGLALLALAPFANALFDADGLTGPLVAAAALPLVQAPENVATTALKLGKSRTISGSVGPAQPGGKVTLTIRKPGFDVVRTLNLMGSRYSFTYRPPVLGNYSVQVSFAQDADSLASKSVVKKFRVIR